MTKTDGHLKGQFYVCDVGDISGVNIKSTNVHEMVS